MVCMCSSPDGKVIAMGLTSGLTVVDASTQQTIATWEHESMEITSIHAAKLADDMYLVSTITDMGKA